MSDEAHVVRLLPERPQLRTEELFEALRARILSDEWPAGSRLPSERELADVYDTNRNTLREGLRRLEQAGLVTVRQGQGVTVADFRKTGSLELVAPFLAHGKDLREKAQMILHVLEPRKRVLEYTVERFVECFGPDDLPLVESAVADLRMAETARDPQRLIVAETRFYEAIVQGTHDQVVCWMARPLLQLNQEVQQRWPAIVVFDPSLTRFTSQLLAAAVARDSKQALLCMRSHYDAIDVTVRAMLAPFVSGGKP
jgi:DNA-binding FadR family transcriptional regulator